jgi:hypothetical protein
MQTKKTGHKKRSSRRNMKGGENEDVLKDLIDNGYFAGMITPEYILDILFKSAEFKSEDDYTKVIDNLPIYKTGNEGDKRNNINTDELRRKIPVWLKMLVDTGYLNLTIERNVRVTNLRPVAKDSKKSYYQGVSEDTPHNLNKDQNDSTDKYTFSIDDNRYNFSVLDRPSREIMEDLKLFTRPDSTTGYNRAENLPKSIQLNISLAIIEQMKINPKGIESNPNGNESTDKGRRGQPSTIKKYKNPILILLLIALFFSLNHELKAVKVTPDNPTHV